MKKYTEDLLPGGSKIPKTTINEPSLCFFTDCAIGKNSYPGAQKKYVKTNEILCSQKKWK